ncbi:MAG: class I SAM-dependent methyltransferase [Gammaproteobacteria bacterium]
MKAILPLISIFLLCSACAEDAPVQDEGERYTYTQKNRDGIGKFYMGREISWTMGHQGAGWLERKTRVQEERTDLLINNLPIQPGDAIADIGAGTGYFSIPMAEMTGPEGSVYAVDIQPEMLTLLESNATRKGVGNIEYVLATERNPNLPPESIDLALMVDAYHEFAWPWEVMSAVYQSLVPGGKIVLIEYRAEDPDVPILRLHKMTEAQAITEMEAIGLEFIKNEDFLPQQHFMVFSKPPAARASQ